MHTPLRSPRISLVWLLCLVSISALHASQTRAQHRRLYSFQAPTGAHPDAVVIASDGALFGAAREGGEFGKGTVFSISPDGASRTLHAFNGENEGAAPTQLAEGPDGALYGLSTLTGTTRSALFRLDRDGSLQILRDMEGDPTTMVLVRGLDGKLYGSNAAASTVFEVKPSGSLSPLLIFPSGMSASTLAVAADGSLYGTAVTNNGAPPQVFRVSMADGTTTMLGQFAAASDDQPTEIPTSLTLTQSGTLYVGVRRAERGVLYRLADAGSLEQIGELDAPVSTLASGSDAAYGVTAGGGESQQGNLFRIAADGGVSSLHAFNGMADGAAPSALAVSGDTVYGASDAAGAGFGTVFKYEGDAFHTVFAFSYPQGINPTSLVRGSDGALYGTTLQGGAHGFGTVFKANVDGSLKTLHDFTKIDGAGPSSIIEGHDSNLYGRTNTGGKTDLGTLFRITRKGELATLVHFGQQGESAGPPLVVANDGNLYGADQADSGHLFRIVDGRKEIVYTFTGLSTRDGALPSALIVGADGNLYGTTLGAYGPLIPPEFSSGTVFRLTPNGAFSTLYAFADDDNSKGASPRMLLLGKDGDIYGTTSNVNFVCGVYGGVWKLGQSSGQLDTVYEFTGASDGTGPSGLVEVGPGAFYGLTLGGVGPAAGSDGCEPRNSTLFEYADGNLQTRETLGYSMVDNTSDVSHAFTLLDGGDGKLYGVLANGGSNAAGELFAYEMAGPTPD
jgi:uncharacterized repeat protein (TIGR03803 family)